MRKKKSKDYFIRRTIPATVVIAFFGITIFLFQNSSTTPTYVYPPLPVFKMPSNYKYISYSRYLIPYVPKVNSQPVSHIAAANSFLVKQASHIIGGQQASGTAGCKTISISYVNKNPKTNLAMRTWTLGCNNQIITLNEVFDKGTGGSPKPIAQFIMKRPVLISNAQAPVKAP